MVPVPTWPVHNNIPVEIGMPLGKYRYYHAETKGLDFKGMVEDLHNAPSGAVVVLHACSHNPTGVDPTVE